MKQLYTAGPLTQTPAPAAVRATTSGLRHDELSDGLASVVYTPPPVGADGGRPLPVRLALLNTESGRVLTHVAPNGGTFFAHTLLNVPATSDAQLAIQTWGSPLWQRHDPDSAADLPELPYLPVADVLDDAALTAWLAAPARRDTLEFVLTALLGAAPDARVFLAAPAADVATVVYAVTRVLPHGLLEDFTFSTFEPDPLACPARLVGSDGGADGWDLPAGCYAGGAVGFNPATGRRSDLGGEVPFAAFAVAALAAGDYAPVDDVKATWQRLGRTGVRQFDLVYRLSRGTGVLTKDEAADALHHPPLAAWVSARTDVLDQLLGWALDDRAFATASFSRVVQALRQRADVVAGLGQTVRERGLQALHAGDRTRTATALEVVLPMVAPAKANAVWGDLLAQLPDPTALSWEMRWYLLPRFVRFKQQQGVTGVDPALAKWLDVPADKLGELLALDLPRAYQMAAARASLSRDGEPSATLTHTLASNPGLTLALLQPAGPPADADRAVKLFESLLAEAPQHPWFEDLLARAGDYPAALLNRFFEAALAAGKVDADRVIRAQGPRLLQLFAGQSGLDRVGAQLLAAPPADLLRNPGLLEFLGRLRDEPAVTDALKDRVRAVQTVRGYFDAPTFEPAAMTAVAAALAVTPPVVPANTTADVFALVASEYLRRATGDAAQDDLEAVLVHFGDVLAQGPTDLYENLLRDLRTRTDFGRHATLVKTFLAVALGAVRSPALAGRLDGLDGHAFAVASDAARRGGTRMLTAVTRQAEAWPKAARTQWGFLLAAVRPRGVRGVLRDAGLVLIGGGIGTAVWWAVRLLA